MCVFSSSWSKVEQAMNEEEEPQQRCCFIIMQIFLMK